MKKVRIVLLLSLLLLLSCNLSKKRTRTNNENIKNTNIEYSNLLDIQKNATYTLVNIKNPWDETTLLATYVLVEKSKEINENLPEGTIVRTPLTSVALTSSVQCSFIEELKQTNTVIGACDLEYIKNESIAQKKKDGTIKHLGMGYSPNLEMLITLAPEVIFCDPVVGQDLTPFENSGITVILTPDYVENNPLGRTEWIKFYALLFDMETVGDSIFNERVLQYKAVKDKIANVQNKPTVFMDMPYQGSWNVSGGKSYIANMFHDAGANYIWRDDVSTSFLPLSVEAVLDKAVAADFWLIKYYNISPLTYESMKAEYKPYSYFDAFKNKKVYANNTLYSSYYEDLPSKPHLLLQDLASIFHPALFTDYENRYYFTID